MAAQAARGSDAGPDGWVEGTFNYLRRSTSDRGSLEVRSQSQADSATKKTVVASMFEPVKTRWQPLLRPPAHVPALVFFFLRQTVRCDKHVSPALLSLAAE